MTSNFRRYLTVAILIMLYLSGYLFISWLGGESGTLSRIWRYLVVPVFFLLAGVWLSVDQFLRDAFTKRFASGKGIVALWTSVLVYVVCLVWLKTAKTLALNYELFDSGLYVNKLWRISASDLIPGLKMALVEGHFQPVAFVYGRLFGYGSPLVFYVLETVAIASGIVPIYLIARKRLGDGYVPILISISYLLNPLVGFNDILGFHPDHLVLPALLWAFFFADRGQFIRMFLTLLILSMTSEPWIPLAAAFGVFVAFEYRRMDLGGFLFLFFLGMFLLVLFWVLPQYGSISGGNRVFGVQGGGSSYGALMSGNFRILLDLRKGVFVYALLLPFLFLSLFSWPVMIVALPDLAKILLSSEYLHYALEGHYTLGLIAVLTMGYISALERIGLKKGWVATERLSIVGFVTVIGLALAHGALPISYDFWTKTSGGAFRYTNYLKSTRTISLQKVDRLVGTDRNDVVEITNDAYTPALARRDTLGLYPSTRWMDADFVVIGQGRYKGAGADSEQDRYACLFNVAYVEMNRYFRLIYRDSNVELWENKMRTGKRML